MSYFLDKDTKPANSIFGDLDLNAFRKSSEPRPVVSTGPAPLFGDVDSKYLTSSYLYAKDDSQLAQDVRMAAPDLAPESVTQFEEDPQVIERFDRIIDYMSNNDNFINALTDHGGYFGNDDVVEFLRDDNMRIASLVNKSSLLKDAPDQIKEDYRFIQERFNKSELSGIKEYMGAFVDYGTDLIFNPETILGVLGAIFSGGSGAGGVAASHASARMALSKVLGKVAAVASPTTAKSAAVYGGVFTGIADFAAQSLDLSIESREEYDLAQMGTAAVFGAGISSAAHLGISKAKQLYASRINRKRVEDEFFTDFTIEDGPNVNQRAREAFEAARRQDEARAAAMPGTAVGFPRSAPDLLDNLTPRLEGPLEADDLVDDEAIKRFAADIGGGQQTEQEIIDAAIAASRKENPEAKQNAFINKIYRLAAGATSNMFGGKAAGILSPYTQGSATARILQRKLSRVW